MSEQAAEPNEAATETAVPESNLPKFAETKVLSGRKYTSPLIACRFDPTGQYVFTAAQDQTIQRWDLDAGEPLVLEGHDSWLRGLGFAPDGQTLYSAGYDGALLFWDLAAEKPTIAKRIDAHHGWIRWLSVSPDGQLIATAGNDLLVKVWRTDDGSQVHELSGHEGHIYSTLFHPQDNFLLSGDLLGKVHQWDLATGQIVRTFDAGDLHTYFGGQEVHYGGVRSMTLSPDGQFLACGGLHKATNPLGAVQEPLVLIFAWENAEKVKSLVADGIDRGILWRTLYHPSGTLLGADGGGSGGFLLFWHPDTEKCVHQFKLPNTVLDMDLHPDGQRVATAHYDQQIRISQLA